MSLPGLLHAQDVQARQSTRPAIHSDRWQEDWSVLADPDLRTQPFDFLKYVPVSPWDADSYLSFGLTLRERFESNDAPGFGTSGREGDSYLLQRLQFHVDLHLFDTWQFFTQFEDVRAPGKEVIGPADENELDLRIAFLGYKHVFDDGTLLARVGRQEIAFDLQRFVSSRDGPNVRQAFDAVWAEWDATPLRIKGFVSQPVQYRNSEPFDDVSNSNIRFSALRFEHDIPEGTLSGYYAFYQNKNAVFLDATGDEERHSIDARLSGRTDSFDWDAEAMGQLGTVGSKEIRAWAAGTRFGYTFNGLPWKPRFGLQMDAASGDSRAGDGTIGTFNGLFANGSYFSLAGYTAYANLLHIKPSISVYPTEKLSLTGAVGLQWRQTTGDAVYVSPNVPIAGTSGKGDRWTGYYAQARMDYAITPNLSAAAEFVHFDVGESLRKAGAHDSNYFGAELKLAW